MMQLHAVGSTVMSLLFGCLVGCRFRAMMDGPSKEEKKPILADPKPQA